MKYDIFMYLCPSPGGGGDFPIEDLMLAFSIITLIRFNPSLLELISDVFHLPQGNKVDCGPTPR